MGKWKLITNQVRQQGHLDKVKEFLKGPDSLTSFEIITPITQDQKIAMVHAPDLASQSIRSIEVIWNKKAAKLLIIAVADKDDISNFKNSVKLCYPNCEFGPVQEEVTPHWFDVTKQYEVFDVSTTHGHSFVILNTTRMLTLMSKICAVVQQSENAWVQFVFQRTDFNSTLDKLSSRIQDLERYLNKPVVYYRESEGRQARLTRDRDEKIGDFNSNVKGIKRHLTERMTGQQIMLSIRGLVEGQNEIDIDPAFSVIDAMPFETLSSSFDHLRKYKYEISTFYNAQKPKKTWVKVGGKKTEISRLEALFKRRLLPEPKKFLNRFCDQYCGTKWYFGLVGTRAYYDRKPLPFLMTGSEVGVILHLPDPNIVQNIHSTRGQTMPRSYHEKTGFLFGKYV